MVDDGNGRAKQVHEMESAVCVAACAGLGTDAEGVGGVGGGMGSQDE